MVRDTMPAKAGGMLTLGICIQPCLVCKPLNSESVGLVVILGCTVTIQAESIVQEGGAVMSSPSDLIDGNCVRVSPQNSGD